MSTLFSDPVAAVLHRLYAQADSQDQPLVAKAKEAARRIGGSIHDHRIANHPDVAPIFDRVYIPVAPEVGRLLYGLVVAKRPRCVVEFGTSLGISTIHLAAGVRDCGSGRVITTEKSTAKAPIARSNLLAAGVADLVELREGDALETLRDGFPEGIDLLFLDGWKDLYLPVLKRVQSRLNGGAIVIADDLKIAGDTLSTYLQYVRDPSNGYVSVEIPLDDGLEVSVRTPLQPAAST